MKYLTKVAVLVALVYMALLIPIMVVTAHMRGYFAIGGEIFIPLVIILFDFMLIYGNEEDYED